MRINKNKNLEKKRTCKKHYTGNFDKKQPYRDMQRCLDNSGTSFARQEFHMLPHLHSNLGLMKGWLHCRIESSFFVGGPPPQGSRFGCIWTSYSRSPSRPGQDSLEALSNPESLYTKAHSSFLCGPQGRCNSCHHTGPADKPLLLI